MVAQRNILTMMGLLRTTRTSSLCRHLLKWLTMRIDTQLKMTLMHIKSVSKHMLEIVILRSLTRKETLSRTLRISQFIQGNTQGHTVNRRGQLVVAILMQIYHKKKKDSKAIAKISKLQQHQVLIIIIIIISISRAIQKTMMMNKINRMGKIMLMRL